MVLTLSYRRLRQLAQFLVSFDGLMEDLALF